jgi:hypothetical protein
VYGQQFDPEWTMKGKFNPIENINFANKSNVDIYQFNTDPDNFVFDGIMTKAHRETMNPT